MSQTISRILFASDFSEGAAHAQAHAVIWAEKTGARLDLLHVLEFQPGMDPEQPVNKMYLDQLRSQADQGLRQIVAALEPTRVTIAARVESGVPSQMIVQTARELDADLIILGTRGLSGLEHLLVGSTAERVIKTAPCPVVAVRTVPQQPGRAAASADMRPSLAIQKMLVPVDFSDCSLEALEYAIFVAKLYQASVTIIHVPEPITFGIDFTLRQVEERRGLRKRTESWLSEVTQLLSTQGVAAGYQVLGGLPADSVPAYARDHSCDLIVMGTHGRRGFSHALSGSVTESVIRHAPCPVLTLKSPKYAAGHQRVLSKHRERLAEAGPP